MTNKSYLLCSSSDVSLGLSLATEDFKKPKLEDHAGLFNIIANADATKAKQSLMTINGVPFNTAIVQKYL